MSLTKLLIFLNTCFKYPVYLIICAYSIARPLCRVGVAMESVQVWHWHILNLRGRRHAESELADSNTKSCLFLLSLSGRLGSSTLSISMLNFLKREIGYGEFYILKSDGRFTYFSSYDMWAISPSAVRQWRHILFKSKISSRTSVCK